MRRGIVKRQRKCVDLAELVRNNRRYQPYSCHRSISNGIHSRSRCIDFLSDYSSAFQYFPASAVGDSHRNSIQTLYKGNHMSTSMHRHLVHDEAPKIISLHRLNCVDRAVNTKIISTQTAFTQYELSPTSSAPINKTDRNELTEITMCKNYLGNVTNEKATVAIMTAEESPISNKSRPDSAVSRGGLNTMSTPKSSKLIQSTSQAVQTESSDSSFKEQANSQLKSEDAQVAKVEADLVEDGELSESENDDEQEDNISDNEDQAPDYIIVGSHSNLSLQLQDFNPVGEDGVDVEVSIADEEAGGDGHHNNSVIEIEITLRPGNEINSDDGDEEEQGEVDAAFEEESE